MLVITGRHLQWFQGAHCSHSLLLLNQKQGVPMAGVPFLGRGRESGGQIELSWEEQMGFSGSGRRVTYEEFEVWVVQPSWKGGGIEHVFHCSGNSQVVPCAVPGSPKWRRFVLWFCSVHSLGRLGFSGHSGVEAALWIAARIAGCDLGLHCSPVHV